ncbi:hypothetical protein V6Z12_A05G023800 [Gossypium hirsutum]
MPQSLLVASPNSNGNTLNNKYKEEKAKFECVLMHDSSPITHFSGFLEFSQSFPGIYIYIFIEQYCSRHIYYLRMQYCGVDYNFLFSSWVELSHIYCRLR